MFGALLCVALPYDLRRTHALTRVAPACAGAKRSCRSTICASSFYSTPRTRRVLESEAFLPSACPHPSARIRSWRGCFACDRRRDDSTRPNEAVGFCAVRDKRGSSLKGYRNGRERIVSQFVHAAVRYTNVESFTAKFVADTENREQFFPKDSAVAIGKTPKVREYPCVPVASHEYSPQGACDSLGPRWSPRVI